MKIFSVEYDIEFTFRICLCFSKSCSPNMNTIYKVSIHIASVMIYIFSCRPVCDGATGEMLTYHYFENQESLRRSALYQMFGCYPQNINKTCSTVITRSNLMVGYLGKTFQTGVSLDKRKGNLRTTLYFDDLR